MIQLYHIWALMMTQGFGLVFLPQVATPKIALLPAVNRIRVIRESLSFACLEKSLQHTGYEIVNPMQLY